MDETRYSFIVDWYDRHAALVRKYQLLYYNVDGTCEMIEMRNRRLFLKRSKCPNVQISDLFIGSIVNILGRQLTISDYGDQFTKVKLQPIMERTLGVIYPDCIDKIGKVLTKICSEGFSICDLRMTKLGRKEIELFYKDCPVTEEVLAYMAEGPIVAFQLMRERAVSKWQELLGPDDPSLARKIAPDSLRAQFGTNEIRNGFYASKSAELAEKGVKFFFGTRRMGKSTALLSNSTLGIIKPHAVKEGLAGQIIEDICTSGFHVSAIGMFHVEKANAEDFYEVYKGVVQEYQPMVEQLSSGPCIAMEILSDNTQQCQVQQLFREMVGPSDPELARHLRPKSLRSTYGKCKALNGIHCTDLPEDQNLEVEYFFKILD